MRANEKTSNWKYRTHLREPAHPLDDDRVSLNTKVSPENASETYRRADLFLKSGEWQAWDHTREIQGDGCLSSAQTTFYSRDLSDTNHKVAKRYDRLWKLHMGRGHTWEKDSNRKTIVRDEATIGRCDAILQSCETPAWARTDALSKVHNTPLQGFSKNYKGADGACIGFALLAMYGDPNEAKKGWVGKRAITQLATHGIDQEFIDRLIDYVFRKDAEEDEE